MTKRYINATVATPALVIVLSPGGGIHLTTAAVVS